jgi:hypothetical protein
MPDINILLFDTPYDGKPLFKSQSELVAGLLNTTFYRIGSQDLFEQTKALNRLKTYVSQLLSGSGNRSITRELREAMAHVLTERLPEPALRARVLDDIFDAMREKSATAAREIKPTIHATFQQQVAASSYVVAITSTQVKVDLAKDGETISLGQFLAADLLDTIRRRRGQIKKYRFNFPLKSDCEVFWIGVRSALSHHLYALSAQTEQEPYFIFDGSSVAPEFLELLNEYRRLQDALLETAAFDLRRKIIQNHSYSFVSMLNRLRIIRVFATEEPIFAIPMIILEPADNANSKLFSLIEDEKSQTHVIQLSREYTIQWRRFVWNKLLTSKSTAEVFFPQSGAKPE